MELRDYQIENAEKLTAIINEHKLAYFAGEVRTGKSLTALKVASNYQKVLFVTKLKAIPSIQNDYKQAVFSFDLHCINYESLHKLTYKPDFVILDEAHGLGAMPKPSLRTKQLKIICKDLPILFLSGTPTPESHSQIYHQLYVSSFSPFAQYINFYKWAKDFVRLKKKYVYNREINDYSDADKDKIKQWTSHFFLSFTQEEAGFTEFVNEHILYVEMPQRIWDLVKIIKRDKVYEFKDGNAVILADTAVKEMSKISQISSGTVKDEDGGCHVLSTAKADFIKTRFAGQKIAIFYKYIAERKMLEKVFENLTDIPEVFQESNDKIFVSQFISGREGINISSADSLIFINLDYSYLSYAQSKARIQTKDRAKEANLYFIFSDNGIERLIYDKVKNKTDFTTHFYKKMQDEIGIGNTIKANKEVQQGGLALL
jgi:hypothetical protein